MCAKTISHATCCVFVMLVISSCTDDSQQSLNGPYPVSSPRQVYIAGQPSLPTQPYNYNNPQASNEIVTLGRVLFYDKALSGDNTISCGSCHKQSSGFADNKPFSAGHSNVATDRNSMSILNLPMMSVLVNEGSATNPYGSVASGGLVGGFFWDGNENSLTRMVLKPVANFNEMGNTNMAAAIQRTTNKAYYTKLFNDAFPNNAGLSLQEQVSRALAGFVSSITTTKTRYDRSKTGTDALTASESNGMMLFKTKYNCNGCHQVDAVSQVSPRFANIGLDMTYADPGLARTTRAGGDQGKFLVPSLRNVEFTGPYMHDGRFVSLTECIQHYKDGIVGHPNLHPDLKDASGAPLKMNISDQEVKDILAFLHTLSDEYILIDPKFSDPF